MKQTMLARLMLSICLGLVSLLAFAQNRTVTGTVTDEKGAPVSGVSVTIKGARGGTSSGNDGAYSISVPASANTLIFSSVGYGRKEVAIGSDNMANASLTATNEQLTDVVVVGYGTARKKDLTGSVGSVSAKDFNKGTSSTPEQLIQGKIAGVQVVNNNGGTPGGGVTVRIRGASSIRGGNTPLYVIDGVPLDNRNSRPGYALPDLGNTPDGNPLNFMNPADIASIDVLKDASAAAIYGSRGANGVVLITTKRGQAGIPKIEFNASYGVGSILKKYEVLTGAQYRDAIERFDTSLRKNNKGGDVNALDAISRKATNQSYNVAMSAGNENARYRVSLGYLGQEGLIKKTNFKKYSASLNSNYKFLESKKLGVDVNMIVSQTTEKIAPITNNAGFRGSLIGQAIQWNPTKSFYKANGSLSIDRGGSQVNPVAMQEAYDDNAKVTTALASIAPYYKITNDLEYKMQFSLNYSTGIRNTAIRNWINVEGIELDSALGRKGGVAAVSQNEIITKQLTHTLSYIKDLSSKISLNAVLGYEFMRFDNKGSGQSARNFENFGSLPYYKYMQYPNPVDRSASSFADPTIDLQSYFGRAIINISEKYLVTATFRADGSSKFGKNNKYGFFPSIAAAWNLSKEDFLKNTNGPVDNIKIRASWGQTGNQEFPAGASQEIYSINQGGIQRSQLENPDLKWETTTSINAGIDFSVLKKINASVEYFNRNTKDLIFARPTGDPVAAGSSIKWENLPGNVINSGVELSLNGQVLRKKDFTFDLGVNLTFQKNKLTNFGLDVPTGEISGPGLTGAYSQLLKNDYPLNVFYLRQYVGINKATGIADYKDGDAKFLMGSPNPTTLVGISARFGYKKFGLETNFNGAYGHWIYNNTANGLLELNNMTQDRNVGLTFYNESVSNGETISNPKSASSRYLEKGNYLKLANATLSYNLGRFGNVVKGSSVYITGQNLFIITKYSGIDPEVNVAKPIGNIPSFGIDNSTYPSVRTFTFGINFSF